MLMKPRLARIQPTPTDGDGWLDGDEVNLGTDPLDPASFPAG